MNLVRDGIGIVVVIVWILSAGWRYTAVANPEPAVSATFESEKPSMKVLAYERSVERCDRIDRGSHFQVRQECLKQWIQPQLSLQDAVDALWPYVTDAEEFYSVTLYTFSYEPTSLVFDANFLTERQERNDAEIVPEDGRYSVPKSYLAMKQAQNRWVYAAVRDISTYGNCRLQNYLIALREINGTLLAPWEKLNLNKIISNQPDYCRGKGENYLFYQGVCGASTQLFRNALINPALRVTKRSAHGKRYAGFYGSTIIGDDASMYQYAKQLEVKNESEQDIYFVTLKRADWNVALVSITPTKSDVVAEISKQQTAEMSALVLQRLVDKDGQEVYSNERKSTYRAIDTTIDTDR